MLRGLERVPYKPAVCDSGASTENVIGVKGSCFMESRCWTGLLAVQHRLRQNKLVSATYALHPLHPLRRLNMERHVFRELGSLQVQRLLVALTRSPSCQSHLTSRSV